MYQQQRMYQPQRKGCLSILRDQAWGGIGVFVGILSLIIAIMALPQAAPVRTQIRNIVAGPGSQVSTAPNPTAATAPTPTEPILASAETLSENLVLKCNECSVPTVVTINSIKVEPQNNRMVWSLLLYNNSESTANCYFDRFSLQSPISDKELSATGEILDINTCLTLDPLAAGEKRPSTVTFSFVPYKKVAYTLNATYFDSNGKEVPMLPVSITF